MRMTRKRWARLTRCTKWIKVAEVCGFTDVVRVDGHYAPPHIEGWIGKGCKRREVIPNYLNDLNAMREAENICLVGPTLWEKYCTHLVSIIEEDDSVDYRNAQCHLPDLVNATAEQKAEALVLTMDPD